MSTATADKASKSKSNGAKQQELPGTPQPTGAGKLALNYISDKEDIDSRYERLEKKAEEVKKAMKEEGRSTLTVQSPESQRKYDFVVRRHEKLSVIRQKEGFKTK